MFFFRLFCTFFFVGEKLFPFFTIFFQDFFIFFFVVNFSLLPISCDYIWNNAKCKANEKEEKSSCESKEIFPFYVFLFRIKLPSDDFIWFTFFLFLSIFFIFVFSVSFAATLETKNWNLPQFIFNIHSRSTFNNVFSSCNFQLQVFMML